jgi:hypothetical protein
MLDIIKMIRGIRMHKVLLRHSLMATKAIREQIKHTKQHVIDLDEEEVHKIETSEDDQASEDRNNLSSC